MLCLSRDTDPHVVEGDPDALGEVLAEQRDLGVALAEVVQQDEVGVHPHADADGLRGRAVREAPGQTSGAFKDAVRSLCRRSDPPVAFLHSLGLQPVLQRGLVDHHGCILSWKQNDKNQKPEWLRASSRPAGNQSGRRRDRVSARPICLAS